MDRLCGIKTRRQYDDKDSKLNRATVRATSLATAIVIHVENKNVRVPMSKVRGGGGGSAKMRQLQ